jgi:glycine cleavage system H protein
MLTLPGFYGRTVTIADDRLYYPRKEVWVKPAADGRTLKVGLTHAAVLLVSGVTLVEFVVEAGQDVALDDKIAFLETYKAIQDLETPVAGTLLRMNGDLVADPVIVEDSPYESGWFFELRAGDRDNWQRRLVDALSYRDILAESEHCGGSRPAWRPHC